MKQFIYFLIASLLMNQVVAEDIYYVHTDHLNVPTLVTDADRTVVWQGQRNPFGETTITVNTIDQPFRFPGQYYDEETGLHYNLMRDYDPSLGRYIQSDPIGLDGGLNTYAYVGGNPLMYVDPDGEFAIALPAVPVVAQFLLDVAAIGVIAVSTIDKPTFHDSSYNSRDRGSATSPAPYTHEEENNALGLSPDPFGSNCRELKKAIDLLRKQIEWRRSDLNPRSISYPGHVTRIKILEKN